MNKQHDVLYLREVPGEPSPPVDWGFVAVWLVSLAFSFAAWAVVVWMVYELALMFGILP